MKIYVGMIAYDEEWIIGYSLKSVYDYVDEIIVIDGSQWGPSTDRTVEIASSVGPKVRVISGTWIAMNKDGQRGTDHKYRQQMEFLENMEKGLDNWCIFMGADEVWDEENIKRLVDYLQKAKGTMLFSYQWLNFYGDCWHTIYGGAWTEPRPVSAFRLIPGITFLNHHRVGIHAPDCPPVNFGELGYPGRIILEDVMFFHYTACCPFEKFKFRMKFYFDRDAHFRRAYGGYEGDEWERFLKEQVTPEWERRCNLEIRGAELKPFKGKHPKVIQPLIDKLWYR